MVVPYPGVLSDRNEGPVLYGSQSISPNNDVITAGFITATVIVAASFLLPYLSHLRPKKKWEVLKYSSVFISLFVWCAIFVCNFGKDWQHGSVTTTTAYVPFRGDNIKAKVGLYIGLRGINVTLQGQPVQQLNETIDYNEEFSWEWQQGIRGHGPYGGRISREYHEATGRGLPYPILWVAEWFTLEGEYIHWGRYYRYAGWYCHILLWIAFVCWAYTNMMFLISPLHGSIGLVITGLIMVLANIVFTGLYNQNRNQLKIPFPDGFITLSYGWSFYLNLITGLFCLVSGLVLVTFYKWPRNERFFYEEKRITELSFQEELEEEKKESNMEIEMEEQNPKKNVTISDLKEFVALRKNTGDSETTAS